nr:hypothetical protein [Tanacetum cinerariifolium]
MEEYMTMTRDDYKSGIDRPKFDDKAHFELKGQFLKELRDNALSFPYVSYGSRKSMAKKQTVSSIDTWETLTRKFLSKYYLPGRTAKKIKEINNFQQEPDETLNQAWERFKELLLRCPQHYLMDIQEMISFYIGLDIPTRQILNSKGVIPSIKAADAKKSIQDMDDHSQKWHNKMSTRTKSCESCGGPHYTKDCPLKEEGKTLEEAYYTQFGVPFPQEGRYRAAAPGFY